MNVQVVLDVFTVPPAMSQRKKYPNFVFNPEDKSIKNFETLINIKQSRLGDIRHDRNSGCTTVSYFYS